MLLCLWAGSGQENDGILSQSSGSVATNTAGTRPCISFKTDPVDEWSLQMLEPLFNMKHTFNRN